MSENQLKSIIPPHTKDSEMMVLGCMLTNINSLNICSDQLDDSDFYFTEHKIIFQVLKTLYKSDKPADIHLVCEELKRQNKLKTIGGVGYVTTLAQFAGTSAHIEHYSDLVQNKSILRRMIQACRSVEKLANSEPKNVYDALDEAQQLFFKISQYSSVSTGVSIIDILSGTKSESGVAYLKELEERQETYKKRPAGDPGITGIQTHFLDLDKLINGLNKSNLIILAGRPAMGKTALALNLAENISFKSQVSVGIFSLEMTAEQLLHRIICSQSEIESNKIQTGSLNGMEYQRVVATANDIKKHTLIIDDQPGIKITDLRARARRMKETHDIGFLIIDYLQLLSGSARNMENRQSEISEISRMLKNLARELNIPVLCLSQLSRRVEERTGHRPMMSDLRESGCLSGDTQIQDADTGQMYDMKELAKRTKQTPLTVYALDKNLKISKHTMTKVFYSGRKTLYELRMRSGRTIKASSNHPFRQLNNWVALENLSPGDQIAIPRSLPEQSSTQKIQNDELIYLAHLLGDGYILPKQPDHYTSANEINISIVNQCAFSLFGIQPRVVKQKNRFHSYFPSPYPLTQEKFHPITLWYDKPGIERVRAPQKRIPGVLFSCDKQQISLFLHHLWAADGNISMKKNKGKSLGASIYYASSGHILSTQVQQLLLRVGIHSTIPSAPSKTGYKTMCPVLIQGASHQKTFLKNIGSAGHRSDITPVFLKSLEETVADPSIDAIPAEAWRLFVQQAKDKAQMSWRDICAGLNTACSSSILLKSGISRKRMHALYEICNDQTLLNLATSDILWDEITSIKELNEEDVYDATVEGVHNFVANDILVHNSIEQDADIVAFMLRREYYDPLDKPGLAELIIAKNRHGAIGNINLTFRKEFGKFANYIPLDEPNEG